MITQAPSALNNGLAVIHSNRLESLRALVVEWLRAHPLDPLEQEIFLVQSNGMAQWLKLALAETDGLGICAAVATQLPARFLWSAYQAVLGAEAVPEESAFDRGSLTWRLFRLIPAQLADPRFAPLRRFLAGDEDGRKRYQLAASLAGLFDQYQVYRADWLGDWQDGRDRLLDAHGQVRTLAEEHAWQPALWRAILRDVPEAERQGSRAGLHERFLDVLQDRAERPDALPRRVVVFGISSLPQQMLKALAALGGHCQVLLCVHNPCRYYWADIVEHKELLRAERRRQPHKPAMPKDMPREELHLHANPLLAAWGKQGRDYIRLMDAFDAPEQYQDWFQRIDLFDDVTGPAGGTLLKQIQQAILDLTPLPQAPDERVLVNPDASVAFHIAHSAQREVEILHDQLLALFAAHAEGGEPLRPRDVIVMVPDIDQYAPSIRAVFGHTDRDDPRHIPYSLADQRERGHNPLVIALEVLLGLPESRFAVSQLLDLLEVAALRRRFAVPDAALPTLHRWIEGAGIRWGLHAEQRAGLDLPDNMEQNSWRFGLRRMLLGYAVGEGAPWLDIEPYAEIGGLDAALVGPLATLLDALETYWRELRQDAAPAVWAERLRGLSAAFFLPDSEQDTLMLERLSDSLERWEAACERAGLEDALPLTVVRDAWLEALDEVSLSQRFLVGKVNFCTLLPMRAIPFKVVCLMGMNDGDYPRNQAPPSFDLMGGPGGYRPGDRSRRDDDRYLFLEAVLSAREHLYISWVGRSMQDNRERPPSLLVSQLRDAIAAGWQAPSAGNGGDGGMRLLQALTVEHPLQPFSPSYFLPPQAEDYDPRLFSYAKEWRIAHDGPPAGEARSIGGLEAFSLDGPLTLDALGRFLRDPVQAFFTNRLKVWFDGAEMPSEDQEPFTFDKLQQYNLADELLQTALSASSGEAPLAFRSAMACQRRRGDLPHGAFAARSQNRYAESAWSAHELARQELIQWPGLATAPLEIRLEFTMDDGDRLVVEDWLTGLRHNEQGQWVHLLVSPQDIKTKQGTPKFHRLVRAWVAHLAACAQGLDLRTRQIGADGILVLRPLPAPEAHAVLQDLVCAWRGGMGRPLPVACKTAFAWLEKAANPDAALEAARGAYEGSYGRSGEVAQNAYLARAFSNFAALRAGGFEVWAQKLYGPLWDAVQKESVS